MIKLERASNQIMNGTIVYLRHFLSMGHSPKQALRKTKQALVILLIRAIDERFK